MPDDSYRTIRALLASTQPDKLREGLRLVELEVAKVGSREAGPLFEMISALFYIDTLDHPELVPILDEAIDLTVRFGAWVIPVLIENLDEGDLKAQWAAANVLGRIGAEAVPPLLREYESTANPTLRAFILYALGKVKASGIVQAVPITLEAARSGNLELRDTATRALGKFVESLPPASLSEKMKRQFIECLRGNLSDANASVRAKAIRGLGKMAKYGHLTKPECEQLKAVCRRITGTDENNEWDRAYVVRKEAAEALTFVG
jgi:HEAT repeat protein